MSPYIYALSYLTVDNDFKKLNILNSYIEIMIVK